MRLDLRWLSGLLFLCGPLFAGTASDIARAIRQNSFDRDECYRVRDLTLVKEDVRIYLTDGHLIFSKPVAGRRIAAVFTADVDGGDGEILVLPPDRAERQSLARYIDSPNLNEHFRAALFLFTGDDYEKLKSQIDKSPTNKKAPEIGAVLDEEWGGVLRNLGDSYQTRLTLDLLGGPGRTGGLFAALVNSLAHGNFDICYDPSSPEQIVIGQLATHDNQLFFDVWTSFQARSFRRNPPRQALDIALRDYRIEATLNPDLSLDTVTRVKIKPVADGLTATTFDIAPQMDVTAVTVDGRPAEVLQRDSLRYNATRNGNNLFLVVPPEPLRQGREYEFEFHHSGKVIYEAGEHVYYVGARGFWYPMHGVQFATYDLRFRYPKNLDLVTPGDVVEDRTDGEWRITLRRAASPIRTAAFNLGEYAHVRLERGPYSVDVCANRALERALQPKPQTISASPLPILGPRRPALLEGTTTTITPPPPDPMGRLQQLAGEVASSIEFMASRFGPPTLPHITVSPIPGTFGQGFPGMIYISTLAYLNKPPAVRGAGDETQKLFFEDILQAHETAHQWWGNRITVGSYRDNWLMEALANYSALMYLEKSKGPRNLDLMLDSYRDELIAKGDGGQAVDSTGPIVLGLRLQNSIEPRAWRVITYGKGSWIIQMLRRQLGDEQFAAMLSEVFKKYDRQEITTEQFRELAARFLPPKSDDPKLEAFFDQWVYGTGIPALKLTYSVKGKAPALRLVGTLTQSDVDQDFSALVPVEIQLSRTRTITQWVRSGGGPATFTVPLKTAPLKVVLDPRHAVLRR
jgi:hypothetical protein